MRSFGHALAATQDLKKQLNSHQNAWVIGYMGY